MWNITKLILNKKGFTLTEVLFATFLTAMIFIVMGNVFIKGHNLFDTLSAQSETQRNGRKIMSTLSAAIRQARVANYSITGGNTLLIDMPIYQTAASTCSAFATVADNTAPVSCSVTTDCATACGGAGSMSCSQSICRRNYTFSVSNANGHPQLVMTAPGESDRTIGNSVSSITFQNQAANANLNSDEIRVVLVTTGTNISERRDQTLTLTGITQMRN